MTPPFSGNATGSQNALTTLPENSGNGCNGCLVPLAVLVLVILGVGLFAFNMIAKIGERERQKMDSPEAVSAREMSAEARSGFFIIRDSVREHFKSTSKIPKDLAEAGLSARLRGKYFTAASYKITTSEGTTVHVICAVTGNDTFTFTFDVADNSEGEFGVASFR